MIAHGIRRRKLPAIRADGTSWMAMFGPDMLTIALELAVQDDVYEDAACKLYEHYLNIANAMDRVGDNADELWDVAREISNRLISIFLRDAQERRPVYGGVKKFQTDPHWRDLIQFYEYFHGDHGAGIGASHQTGWTGFVAKLIQFYGRHQSGADFLALDRDAIPFHVA